MRYKHYLDDVCKEIRFKAAHRVLRQELTAHIDDKKETLAQNGAEDAESQAIAAMGDASETGRALGAIHKPRIEWGVITSVLLISIIGVIAYIFITMDNVLSLSSTGMLSRIIPIIIGFGGMVGMMLMNYDFLKRIRVILYIAAFAVIIIQLIIQNFVFYFYISYTIGYTVSASLYIISIAGFIGAAKGKGVKRLILVGALCAASLFSMLVFPSMYNIIVLTIVYLAMIMCAIYRGTFADKHRSRYALAVVCAIFVALCLMVIIFPNGVERLIVRMSRSSEFGGANAGGYTAMVREMLEGAKWAGPSRQYLMHGIRELLMSETNYVFAAIVGKFGWLFSGLIIAIFTAMFIFMIVRSTKIRHTFGKLLSIGISSYFLVRFVLSVLINFGVFGGMDSALPFISFGRIEYIINALLIGLFLSVWRRSTFMSENTNDERRVLVSRTR